MATIQTQTLAPTGRIPAAIARASTRTGVDFGYLMNKAHLESGLNPEARASTSSATGLFQFTEQTWLRMVKAHGAEFGLAWAANQISVGSDGRHSVANADARLAILDLRTDIDAASAMAGALAADNRTHLETGLGRSIEPVDMYLAHFLGADGALKFLRAMDRDPNLSGAALFPEAAAANRSVFFNAQGMALSLGEIRARFSEKLSAGGHPHGPTTPGDPPKAAATEHRLKMGRIVPMPGQLSVAFAQASYARLADMNAGA